MIKNLTPTIIQDYKTNRVYMLGFSTKGSLRKTKFTGFVHFWSRSRKKIWMKGEKSGNSLQIKEIYFDCDKDTLLFKVKLSAKYVCHKNRISCFFNLYDDIK